MAVAQKEKDQHQGYCVVMIYGSSTEGERPTPGYSVCGKWGNQILCEVRDSLADVLFFVTPKHLI